MLVNQSVTYVGELDQLWIQNFSLCSLCPLESAANEWLNFPDGKFFIENSSG